MMKSIVGLILGPLFAALFFSSANAEECISHKSATEALEQKYGEIETARALSSSERQPHAIALFVSASTGTWTIVAITPRNCATVIDAGEGWSTVTPGSPS